MSVPTEVLLARAVHAFEGAQLQIAAGRYSDAADSIAHGVQLVKQAIER